VRLQLHGFIPAVARLHSTVRLTMSVLRNCQSYNRSNVCNLYFMTDHLLVVLL